MQGVGRLASGILGAYRRRSPVDVLEAATSQVCDAGGVMLSSTTHYALLFWPTKPIIMYGVRSTAWVSNFN